MQKTTDYHPSESFQIFSHHRYIFWFFAYFFPPQLIDTLPAVFRTVMKKYNLAPGDFPDIRDFQEKLSEMDFTKFHSLKQKLIDDIEGVLGNDIPRLMEGEREIQLMYLCFYSVITLLS